MQYESATNNSLSPRMVFSINDSYKNSSFYNIECIYNVLCTIEKTKMIDIGDRLVQTKVRYKQSGM